MNKFTTEIFNDMSFEEINCTVNDNETETFQKEIIEYLQPTLKVKTIDSVENGIEAATKAQKKWTTESSLWKATYLYKVGKKFSDTIQRSSLLLKCKDINSTLILDYINYNSDWTLFSNNYNICTFTEVVFVVFSKECPFHILTATIFAAVAFGCSVIVQLPKEKSWFPLLLANIFFETGLPDNLLCILTEPVNNYQFTEKIHKVIFFGSHSESQYFYKNNLSVSFSFLCPNNTAALILESCDLNAAVSKIVSETWNVNPDKMWAVSNVIVQESIYEKFLDKLKFRMEMLEMEKQKISYFYDKVLIEKINDIAKEATKSGAVVFRNSVSETEWSPIVIIHYQDQNIEPGLPIIKIQICRTASEGVSLLNNTMYCLGTSVWTETSAQALEVASMLNCKNIWINCHGVTEATVPFQPTGLSGNFVFGGFEGIQEFITKKIEYFPDSDKNAEIWSQTEKSGVIQVIIQAQIAFNEWSLHKNRRHYIINIARVIENDKELSTFSEGIQFSHTLNTVNLTQGTHECEIIYKKVPVGVIAIVVNDIVNQMEIVVALISPAIATGNTVVLVLKEIGGSVKKLLNHFKGILPKNVLNVMVGTSAFSFASEPNINALWLYDSQLSKNYIKIIREFSVKSMKYIWIVPKIQFITRQLLQRECLKNKVIWLTKVNKFP